MSSTSPLNYRRKGSSLGRNHIRLYIACHKTKGLLLRPYKMQILPQPQLLMRISPPKLLDLTLLPIKPLILIHRLHGIHLIIQRIGMAFCVILVYSISYVRSTFGLAMGLGGSVHSGLCWEWRCGAVNSSLR